VRYNCIEDPKIGSEDFCNPCVTVAFMTPQSLCSSSVKALPFAQLSNLSKVYLWDEGTATEGTTQNRNEHF